VVIAGSPALAGRRGNPMRLLHFVRNDNLQGLDHLYFESRQAGLVSNGSLRDTSPEFRASHLVTAQSLKSCCHSAPDCMQGRLKPVDAVDLLLRNIKYISAREQFLLQEKSRQPIVLLCKTGGIIESPLGLQHGGPEMDQIILIQ